jgi:hypothetical protein
LSHDHTLLAIASAIMIDGAGSANVDDATWRKVGLLRMPIALALAGLAALA